MSRPKQINPEAAFQSIRGAAQITGLSQKFIRDGCKNGTIPCIRVGVDYRVIMEAWMKQMYSEGGVMR